MEKDVDEVGKITRVIKSKIEELDREVRAVVTYSSKLAVCKIICTDTLSSSMQNLSNRQKPGCGKGSAVDRSRTATTV